MGTIYPGAPGATGRQVRARPLAEHATLNTTEEANDRCRTSDDSTAEDEHSDHNRTTPAIRQAPTWAPFTFQRLSCQLSNASHCRFVEARPARPTSTRLRSRHARDAPSGGSIVVQTKTHTGPCRHIARKDWRNHGARDEMPGTRGQSGPPASHWRRLRAQAEHSHTASARRPAQARTRRPKSRKGSGTASTPNRRPWASAQGLPCKRGEEMNKRKAATTLTVAVALLVLATLTVLPQPERNPYGMHEVVAVEEDAAEDEREAEG